MHLPTHPTLADFSATMIGQPILLTTDEASAIARSVYGVQAEAVLLTGERDENFRLKAPTGEGYVLKVSSPEEDPLITDLPTAAMLHIEKVDPTLPCPRVVRDLKGQTSSRITDSSGALRTVRLLTWLPGVMLQASERTQVQRRACGVICARMGQALRGFHHPAGRRPLLWDYRHVAALGPVLEDVLKHQPGYGPAKFVSSFLGQYMKHAQPRFDLLRQQVLHNDMNLRNVLVDPQDNTRIAGVIDFGDMVDSALAGDVAITATAQVTSAATLEAEVLDMVQAYHAVEPLQQAELFMLPWLIRARLVMGILIPAWHHIKNPTNEHYEGKKEAEISERIEMSEILGDMRISLDQLS